MKIIFWEKRRRGPEPDRSGPVRGLNGPKRRRGGAMARIAAGAGEAADSGYSVSGARRLRGRAGAWTFPVSSSSRQPFM